jgi:chromosomal replication initiator protein
MVDVLLMDDIQFIGGKDSTQEEFFHTFNALHMFNRQIVLASDRHPSELQDVVDRLKSRFQGGLTMKIEPPEFETRLAILDLWAQERQVRLETEVRVMLADRAKSSIRELQSMFNQVVATMQLKRENVNARQAHSILEHHRRPRQHVSLTKVLDMTASYHGVTVEDLVGPRRSGPLNQARQIAMFLAREMTDASLPQIGAAFGGRAHSTVLHSCNKVAEALTIDAELRQAIVKLRESITKTNQ